MTYADTSFLASLYLADANTPKAIKLAQSGTGPYALTLFSHLELSNAVRLACFRGMINNQQATGLWKHSYSSIHRYVENATTRELQLWISLAILRILKRFAAIEENEE